MSQSSDVRVRIAPSPTGDPHVGLAYVTLFNYALAKKHGGKLVLRIEDTDQARAKHSSDLMIMESLKWLGLQWDEGPDVGGDLGPYRQSERTDIYQKHVDKLLNEKKAYHCFCTSERLDEMRKAQKEAGQNPGYDRLCRDISLEDALKRKENGEACVVRMKMPLEGEIVFEDELRGEIKINASQLDDQVVLKSDGFPTYHLANVVDDHLMKISHVMRAEEWISSTPKHVELYKAFGWEMPKFVHLPLLRNPNKSKISKRKNPTSLNYYKRKGILPEAMVNFLALMGWSYGQDTEHFSLSEMIERFELKNMSLGGPVFDVVKLLSFNQHYLQKLSVKEFTSYIRDQVFSEQYLEKLYPLVINRLPSFESFVDSTPFFFNGALDYSACKWPKGVEEPALKKMLKDLVLELDELYDWSAENIQKVIDQHRQKIEWKPKHYFMSLRLITMGRQDSPPLAESLEVIGREMVRFRIREASQRNQLMGA